ncbi:MAG: hypothetical protein ACRC62_20370 [Microcoleus sp.]
MTIVPIIASVDKRSATDLALLITDVIDSGILRNYRDFYNHHRNKTAQRYRIAAASTPYAASSKGKKKSKSGRRIPDRAFGIDSGALFTDTVNNRRITRDEGLTYYSDLTYSAYVMARFAQKGPFAPDDVLFVDDEDISRFEEMAAENYARAFG